MWQRDKMKTLCPHCEKPLGVAHDANACRRRMSRRFFFALAVAPLAAVIAAKGAPRYGDFYVIGSRLSLVTLERFIHTDESRPSVFLTR